MLGAKIFAANEVGGADGSDGWKYVKPKTRRSESQKSFKSKKRQKIGIYPNLTLKKTD